MRPPIQMHNLAVDEMRRLEVQYQVRNFLGLPHAPERAKPAQKVMRRRGVHRSVDGPWSNRIEAYPIAGVFDGQCANDALQAAFAQAA